MACNNPIKIYSKKYKTYFTAPCNYCLKCRIDRRNAWSDRILFESKGKSNSFTTLTYDDNHLENESLSKDEAIKFIKKLRRNIERGKGEKQGISRETKIKYYLVGEYGGQLGRKHYHVIFLGLDFEKSRRLIYETWGKGMIKNLPLNQGSIRYVLKYIDKQVWGKKKEELYKDKEPPFCLMSKGIGKDYLAENIVKIEEKGGYISKGKIRPIPKYWHDLLLMRDMADTQRLKTKIEEMKSAGYRNYEEYRKNIGYLKEKQMIEELRRSGTGINEDYIKSWEKTTNEVIQEVTL